MVPRQQATFAAGRRAPLPEAVQWIRPNDRTIIVALLLSYPTKHEKPRWTPFVPFSCFFYRWVVLPLGSTRWINSREDASTKLWSLLTPFGHTMHSWIRPRRRSAHWSVKTTVHKKAHVLWSSLIDSTSTCLTIMLRNSPWNVNYIPPTLWMPNNTRW